MDAAHGVALSADPLYRVWDEATRGVTCRVREYSKYFPVTIIHKSHTSNVRIIYSTVGVLFVNPFPADVESLGSTYFSHTQNLFL